MRAAGFRCSPLVVLELLLALPCPAPEHTQEQIVRGLAVVV
jgi:hypothetical protein